MNRTAAVIIMPLAAILVYAEESPGDKLHVKSQLFRRRLHSRLHIFIM